MNGNEANNLIVETFEARNKQIGFTFWKTEDYDIRKFARYLTETDIELTWFNVLTLAGMFKRKRRRYYSAN